MQNSTNFKVNRSSAGSGKTYALSLNFIALALVGSVKHYTEYYRRILAITFTNKAAAEMKERVLEYLDVLSVGDNKDGVLDWLLQETTLSKNQIISESEKVKSSILHNYADLRISTIDKFTYNIVRTFSSDLGLSYNFELEMDNYQIIQPVVSILLSKMSAKGGDLSDALVNFALQKAEDGKSTNIATDLESFSENLFKEEAIPFIAANSVSVSECLKLKDDLLSRKNKILKDVKQLSNSVISFFNKHNFSNEHFVRGTFFNHFTKNLQSSQSEKWTPTETLMNNVSEDIWYSQSKSDDIKQLVDSHKSTLISFFTDLQSLISNYNSVQALFVNIYSIAVLNELLAEVTEYKKEQNIEQISVFNKKIHDVIIKQPSSFIYERIGERYNHFLIDEFQDTSLLQWQNLLPLITESVDYGSCFIVGDGKQSIYRWRGGEVEQFLKIPEIFKGEDLPEKQEWENKLNHHFEEGKGENQNYRSRKKIIKFNNKFFNNLKQKLSTSFQSIYDNSSQNSDFAKDGGYVHVELFKDDGEGFKQNILTRIIQEITKITSENKFSYKDITILCNSRKRVSLVAETLSENGIDVVSNDGLLINSSPKVRVVVSVLKHLTDNKDNIAKLDIINYLQEKSPLSEDFHSINLKLKTNFDDLLSDFTVSLDRSYILRLPLYEIIENLYKIFKINEDIYTSFFLDSILKFSEKNGSNIAEFLDWWEEKKNKESVVVPEGTDAVQVMTIHKSKGLAFNVVMIPFNWEGGRNYSEIWVDAASQTNGVLKSTLIRGSKKLQNSCFSSEYTKEQDLKFLDSLNKLYVATTRPIERLYIFSKEYPNITDTFLNSGKLNAFLYLFGIDNSYVDGNPNESHYVKKSEGLKIYSCNKTTKTDWQKVVSLKRSSEKSWDLELNDTNKDWGKLLHLALSKIQHRKNVSEVCLQLYWSGLCSLKTKEKLEKEISTLLSHPQIQMFFDSCWEVKNEREILMNDGSTYIPDRLLFSEEKTVIVDYKTGTPDSSHIMQIENYASVLKQMGYGIIDKYLIYTKSENLVRKI